MGPVAGYLRPGAAVVVVMGKEVAARTGDIPPIDEPQSLMGSPRATLRGDVLAGMGWGLSTGVLTSGLPRQNPTRWGA